MSFLDLNLDNAWNPETLPTDSEVQLRIISAGEHISENSGKTSIHVVLEDPSNPRIEDIHTYLGVPGEGDDEKTANRKRVRIKDFCDCFSIDYSAGLDLESANGLTGYVIVGTDENPEYGVRNTVKRFVVGN